MCGRHRVHAARMTFIVVAGMGSALISIMG
jgi:hypothetical protein